MTGPAVLLHRSLVLAATPAEALQVGHAGLTGAGGTALVLCEHR